MLTHPNRILVLSSPGCHTGSAGERVGEPQRGDLTKPRLKAWVNGTQTDTRALKGAEQSSSIPHVPFIVGDSGMGEDLFRPSRAGGKIWG